MGRTRLTRRLVRVTLGGGRTSESIDKYLVKSDILTEMRGKWGQCKTAAHLKKESLNSCFNINMLWYA